MKFIFNFTPFLCVLLSFQCLAAVVSLSDYETKIFSQNGEDGVIQKLFDILGCDSKYTVEFGGFDGYLCSNTRFWREKGWDGLLLDGGYENLSINLHREFVTAENINDLFEKYEVPMNLDLLSIDIDFNDFYVWLSLADKYRPRIVVVEYNASHLPGEDKIVKYDPYYISDGSNYFGASALAFYRLAREKGYSLVYAESQGVNLFFVRDDLIAESEVEFEDLNNVPLLYRAPRYGKGPNGGHFADPLNRKYLSSEQFLNQ